MTGSLLLLTMAIVCASVVGACHNPITGTELTGQNSALSMAVFGGLNSNLGVKVHAAGDVNSDGIDDAAISSKTSSSTCEMILVFGRRNWALVSPQTLNFSAHTTTPDNSIWIKISDFSSSTPYFTSIAHGDFNGDGVSDLVLSTNSVGKAFVIYGHPGTWISFNVDSISAGTVPGFQINGVPQSIYSLVGNAGDMNGDGIEDVLVTSYTSSLYTPYIIFGQSGADRADFDLASISGTNGFKCFGSPELGYDVMDSPGDVNGDGLADLALGSNMAASGRGHAYIVFARKVSTAGQWGASFDVNTLDGTNGFIIQGNPGNGLGHSVVSAGDINGDGYKDIYIASSTSSDGAWVVFGHASAWPSMINVSQLTGTNGFHFDGQSDFWGLSGGAAGDVNGDGIDDLVIGGCDAFDYAAVSQTGAAVVIFGHLGTWAPQIGRGDAVGAGGFQIDGPSGSSRFGRSVRTAGDLNDDGVADIIIGAPAHNNDAGFVALIFGANDHCAVCSTTDGKVCETCRNGYSIVDNVCKSASSGGHTNSDSTGAASSSSYHIIYVAMLFVVMMLLVL